MDCTEDTLQRMRAAVDNEMTDLEERLTDADEHFGQYIEIGNAAWPPILTAYRPRYTC